VPEIKWSTALEVGKEIKWDGFHIKLMPFFSRLCLVVGEEFVGSCFYK
jgi:hypothetical protein